METKGQVGLGEGKGERLGPLLFGKILNLR